MRFSLSATFFYTALLLGGVAGDPTDCDGGQQFGYLTLYRDDLGETVGYIAYYLDTAGLFHSYLSVSPSAPDERKPVDVFQICSSESPQRIEYIVSARLRQTMSKD